MSYSLDIRVLFLTNCADLSGRIALQIFCQMALGMETGVLKGDLSSLSDKHALVDAVFDLSNISSGRLFNPVWKLTDKARIVYIYTFCWTILTRPIV